MSFSTDGSPQFPSCFLPLTIHGKDTKVTYVATCVSDYVLKNGSPRTGYVTLISFKQLTDENVFNHHRGNQSS